MNERTGTYGIYYGSFYDESSPCSASEQETNATYIYKYLSAKGWSLNAISALLGNMQAESSINPGRWQSDSVGWSEGGYGLVQWTPTTKYFEWCTSQGFSDPSEMDNNLSRIIYELENSIQWYSTDKYPLTFKEFSTSNESVTYLAGAFVLNYERPADQSEAVQTFRGELASNWYTYLSGETPETPDTPDEPDTPDVPSITTKLKKRQFNFLLMCRRKRGKQYGKNRNY